MRRRLLALVLLLCSTGAVALETLYLYNWNNYIAPATLQRFQQRCACRVHQDFYSDNEEMLARLDAGATGYDILVPTGNAVETLIRQGALAPLDLAALPHLDNIKPAFRHPWYDPGNRYAVPYAYSVTLIGYNVERLRALGLPHDSWALIFEPRYLRKLRGRVTVLNSQKELMGAAMRYLGYSVQEHDMRKWEQAKALILRAKPYWAAFSNSTYIKDLAIGNIWVAHGYSNDMFRAREDARAARRPYTIAMATPREGAVLAVDNLVLHRDGRHPALAHRFIDFLLEGENSAELSNLLGAGNPNRAALGRIRPEISGDPDLFPDAAQLARLEMLRDFAPQERRKLGRMWTEIKAR